MKFAVNRYDVDFHIIPDDPAPLPAAQIEEHPFGVPPVEIRPIWMIEIANLETILKLVVEQGLILQLSLSGYWSGADRENPGQRLFGISLIDDPDYEIDPRDRPILLARPPR